jgi:CRISPR-associated protein Cmr1
MMEFSAPKTITAHYKITTPMFLGGEEQQADARQFRNASFKGALRFWWRALNWGRVLQAAAGDRAQALKNLHAEEGRLFGLASDGKDSRQSLVQISSALPPRGNVAAADLDRLGKLCKTPLFQQIRAHPMMDAIKV